MKTLRSESGIFPIIGLVLIAMAVWSCGYITSLHAQRDDKQQRLELAQR
jgi:hypothetical protein